MLYVFRGLSDQDNYVFRGVMPYVFRGFLSEGPLLLVLRGILTVVLWY